MGQEIDYIEIAGTVKAVLFQNEENGYTVAKLETGDGEMITAVGCLPYVSIGEQLLLTGEQSTHASYGEQLKVVWAERRMPSGVDAIYDFLSSRAIKGIGPATATMLISRFGEKTLAVIENEPERLAEMKGISRKKAFEISESLKRQIVVRRLMELLSNHDIKPIYAVRLYRVYGDEAITIVRDNPYVITGEAIGASFAEADRFALGEGFESDSPERVAAAALFELKHNTRNGHSFIPVETLIAITSELISVAAESVEEALEVLSESGELVRTEIAGRDACYLAYLYEAEEFVAQRIKQMTEEKPASRGDIDKIIAEIEKEQSVQYADLQLFSIKAAASNRVMALTGGPGTGKTTTVRAIVSLFEKLGLETLLTAPTGRAAKRMSELSGKNAVTVHRLLEANAPDSGDGVAFRRNEDEPLKCDAVILDECSMVDITLFRALLAAMPEDCRLVLVGDADQLPSVGPGNVFSDILRSGMVETVYLTEVFRQTAQSRIVANAHKINRGEYPDLAANSGESDFFFLRRTNSQQVLETVLKLCTRRLPERMGIPAGDIQVLSPTRKGATGTVNLNTLLQGNLNRPEAGKKEKKFGEITFRQGDRVMQIRNNYDIITAKLLLSDNLNPSAPRCAGTAEDDKMAAKQPFVPVLNKIEYETAEKSAGVYNGDIGVIVDIDEENQQLLVLYDDRLAFYGFELLAELEHAFAMTVHKSQGSEYRAVILIAATGAPQLLSRRVLYTAVTRAKELLIIVGNDSTVFSMIDNHKISRRYSGLRARLTE